MTRTYKELYKTWKKIVASKRSLRMAGFGEGEDSFKMWINDNLRVLERGGW